MNEVLNTEKSSVAILMTTFNGSLWMRQQLESIISQTHKNLTLYIRDDGSTDNTIQLLESFVKIDTRIILLKDEEVGPTGSPALNIFRMIDILDLDKYDFIGFSDQDDIWLPDKIQIALESLGLHSTNCYCSDLLTFDKPNGKLKVLKKSYKQKEYDYIFQGGSAGSTYILDKYSFDLVRRKLKENPMPNVSHDWLIYAITRSYGFKWFFDTRKRIHHRLHADNNWGNYSGLQKIRLNLKRGKDGFLSHTVPHIGKFLNHSDAENIILKRFSSATYKDRVILAFSSYQLRRSFSEVLQLIVFLLFIHSGRPKS